MRKNGFTLVEILAAIAIFTIIIMIAVPGYNYIVNQVQTNMYENKLKLVKIAAENFAFETGLTVTNINHLIEIGKLEADNENGDYRNPVDNTNLLCRVVQIRKSDRDYIVEVTNQEVCDYEQLTLSQSKVYLNRYDESGNILLNSSWNRGWTNGKVILELELNLDFNYPDEITQIRWVGNNNEKVISVNKDFEEKRRYVVEASQLLNTDYEAHVTFLHEGQEVTYSTTTKVKIDHQAPSLYQEDIIVMDAEKWTRDTKDVTFTMNDSSGSGVYGYAILRDSNACRLASYTKTDKLTITKAMGAGTYYLCVRDNAGNYSEEYSSHMFQVERIDSKAPNIQVEVSKNWGKENTASFTIIDHESGVVAYSLGPDNVFEDWVNVDRTSNYSFSQKFSNNGTYYIYAKDEVGSISKQAFHISYIDVSAPQITFARVVSKQDYNGLSVEIQINATDEMPMKMCVSNSGYEVGCSWEDYTAKKNWNLSGSLDGEPRIIYVTLEDGVGNKTHQEFVYDIYHECDANTYIQYGEFGACNCDSGFKIRNNIIMDSYTNKVCSTDTETASCSDSCGH